MGRLVIAESYEQYFDKSLDSSSVQVQNVGKNDAACFSFVSEHSSIQTLTV
jgi:hypothetical protein